jgi:hypothetical protein
MKSNVFTIRDDKAQCYMPPFYSPNSGTAMRAISELLLDPQHTFTKHSEDYSLWLLGSYDDNTGKFDTTAPEHVINIIELKDVS